MIEMEVAQKLHKNTEAALLFRDISQAAWMHSESKYDQVMEACASAATSNDLVGLLKFIKATFA